MCVNCEEENDEVHRPETFIKNLLDVNADAKDNWNPTAISDSNAADVRLHLGREFWRISHSHLFDLEIRDCAMGTFLTALRRCQTLVGHR